MTGEREERARECLAKAYERNHLQGVADWLRTSPLVMNTNYGVAIEAIMLAFSAQERDAAGEGDVVEVFEAWWATSPRRNRDLIGYSDKKCLAFDAFSAGRPAYPAPATDNAVLVERLEADVLHAINYGESRLHSWRNNDPERIPKELRCIRTLIAALRSPSTTAPQQP